MREASRLLALTAIGLTIAFSSPVSAQSGGSKGDPAHVLAEKFSAEADRPAKEAAAKREAQRRAEEAEMLATAKAEAEARREALEQSRAAALLAEQHRIAEEKRMAEAKASEARKVAEEKRAAEARRVAEAKAADDARKAAEAARIAEQKAAEAKAAEAKAVEERHIAELKAAEDQRRAAAEAKAAEDRRIAEAKALEENRLKAEAARLAKQKQDEAHRIADAKRAEEHRRQAEVEAETQARARTQAQAQAMAAEREAEAQRVAERLREAHARRANANAGNTNQTAASAPQPLQPPAGLGGPAQAPPVSQPWNVWTTPAQANRSGPARVTVLLLMEPGNRGIRRHNKTADPLLCNGGGCFVSNGSEAAATFMPGRRALGADRTFGERAGACSQSLGCVFRDVDLGTLPVSVQPIDMRVMHHDRREARTIDTPADCRALAGRLMCRRTIQSSDYTMWVVPEDLARSIGPAALERALAEGLPDSEQAALPPPALPYPWRR